MAQTYAALTVAKFFLSIPDEDSGELISNLKLQKLLYYSQGHYVALNGRSNPLFRDKIYAWKNGPVVKNVYHHYKGAGNNALPVETKPTVIGSEEVSFLSEVYRVYGRFSAWALREMTHRESPWLNNYEPNIADIEIRLSDLEAFFESKVKRVAQ